MNLNSVQAQSPGDRLWTCAVGGPIYDSSPAIGLYEHIIYVGAADTVFYAIGQGGHIIWSYKTGGQIHSSPAIAADGTVYVGSMDGYLYAFDPYGAIEWTYSTGSVFMSVVCFW